MLLTLYYNLDNMYIHCKIKERSTNNTKKRNTAEIKLRISNKRGGHYFMYLKTGRQLHSYQWKELHITGAVIYCIEEMATAEEAPEMIDG